MLEPVFVYLGVDSDLVFGRLKSIHLPRLVHRPQRPPPPPTTTTDSNNRIEWIEVPTLLAAMEVTRVSRPRSSATVDEQTFEISIPVDVRRDAFLLNSTSMAMDAMPTGKRRWKRVTTGHVTTNQKTIKVCSSPLSSISVSTLSLLLANTDEKIIDYDPNDPNLVDEPYLDVDNPYEGLGPGRPDSIGRALMPTAGRHSPDSIGQGKHRRAALSLCFHVCSLSQLLPATAKITGH